MPGPPVASTRASVLYLLMANLVNYKVTRSWIQKQEKSSNVTFIRRDKKRGVVKEEKKLSRMASLGKRCKTCHNINTNPDGIIPLVPILGIPIICAGLTAQLLFLQIPQIIK